AVAIALALALPLLLLRSYGEVPPASAAPGDTPPRTITVDPPPNCPTALGVGVAFDGRELLVSCISSNVITRVDPDTARNLGELVIQGMLAQVGGDSPDGISGLSWDPNHGWLWLATAQDAEQKVYSATLDKAAGTGLATLRITHAAGGSTIVDGLAY